jgi:putative hydrolase of the HAD superfamily
MTFTTLFFDLDDTLYPPSTGLWAAIRERIDRYMVERLGFAAEEVPELRQELFRKYGTTMRGLQQTLHIDTRDYLAYVHDVPVAAHISPNPRLREILAQLPQHKLIFTNADTAHARRVQVALEVEGCFDRVIDILDIDPYCKPQREGFEIALGLAGNPAPADCVLIDDAPRNLEMAAQMGFYTVLVGENGPHHSAHAWITTITDLEKALNLKGEG